jgi:SSS family solute:Na+ symporter
MGFVSANRIRAFVTATGLTVGLLLSVGSPACVAGVTTTAATASDGAELATASLPPRAAHPRGLSVLDWSIVVSYMAGLILLGWACSRARLSASEYFTGNAAVNPGIAGISLFTSLLSTVTYLSLPGEMIGKGPVILAWLLGLPVAYLVVGYVIIPTYMRHRVTSAYELLEARLGLSARLVGATLFILLRLMWMSVVTFIGATAMVAVLGVPPEQRDIWCVGIGVVTGLATIIYTSLGGLKAVMIADLAQSVLLLSGTVLVIATVTWSMGGLSWLPTTWHRGWDTQPFASFDPTIRTTVLGTILFSTVWSICTAGGDQLSVQRFMSTRDLHTARRAYGISLIAAAVVMTMLAVVGLALMGFFESGTAPLPENFDLRRDADRIFPHYIACYLPTGIAGLIVAALLAAQMSGLDSGLNAITAVIWTDWIERTGVRFPSEPARAWAMRGMTFTIGVAVLSVSLLVGRIDSNFLELIQRTANLLTPSIFALFVFAFFIPGANAVGALTGTAFGITAAVLIAFSKTLFSYPISFQWIGITSLLVNLVMGTIVSRLYSAVFRTREAMVDE